MVLQNQAHSSRCFPARGLAAFAALLGGLALTGCGSGVATSLPPSINKPTPGAPSGPALGYIFSPTDGTLRAMLGVKGSSQMSASIVPAGVYVAGDASTASSAALLEDSTGSLFAFDLPLSQPLHVADNLPANAHIVFSSTGTTAIAYGIGGSSIALITGLPTTPQVQTINVPAANSLASAVVSDAGTIVMASAGSPITIGKLSATGQFTRFTTVAAAGGLNFLPGSDSLLIADNSANTVSLVSNVSTGPSIQPLSVAGLNQPIAIAASKDNKWAIVANGGDAGVLRVDLTTGTPAAKVLCACQPTQLASLAGGGVFRVNALYGGPVWTVDLTSVTPQLLFVPAIAKGTP
jgi:hypothetical protein